MTVGKGLDIPFLNEENHYPKSFLPNLIVAILYWEERLTTHYLFHSFETLQLTNILAIND